MGIWGLKNADLLLQLSFPQSQAVHSANRDREESTAEEHGDTLKLGWTSGRRPK